MNNEDITQKEREELEKTSRLENAALFGTAQEIAELYKELGSVEVSAVALGYACRYRGPEHVKALVENGADFNIENDSYGRYQCWNTNYFICILDINMEM